MWQSRAVVFRNRELAQLASKGGSPFARRARRDEHRLSPGRRRICVKRSDRMNRQQNVGTMCSLFDSSFMQERSVLATRSPERRLGAVWSDPADTRFEGLIKKTTKKSWTAQPMSPDTLKVLNSVWWEISFMPGCDGLFLPVRKEEPKIFPPYPVWSPFSPFSFTATQCNFEENCGTVYIFLNVLTIYVYTV